MPDTGAPWELPYPAIGEQADVPGDMGALAEKVAEGLESLSPVRVFRSFQRTIDQTIANATPTIVNYNVVDSGAAGGLGSVGGVITVTDPGLYLITCRFWFAAAANGYRLGWLYKNTSTRLARFGRADPPNGSAEAGGAISLVVPFAAGETLECQVAQSSGGSLAISGNNNTNGLAMTRIGV